MLWLTPCAEPPCRARIAAASCRVATIPDGGFRFQADRVRKSSGPIGGEADEHDVARFIHLCDGGVGLHELGEALVAERLLAEGRVEPLDQALHRRRVLPLDIFLV